MAGFVARRTDLTNDLVVLQYSPACKHALVSTIGLSWVYGRGGRHGRTDLVAETTQAEPARREGKKDRASAPDSLILTES